MSSSAYHAFSDLLASQGAQTTPAELHGLLVGRSCAGAGFAAEPWLRDAADLLGTQPEDSLKQALIGLQEMVRGELSGEDVTLVLLLPPDESPLVERAVALGQWCMGFLAGFGLTERTSPLSEQATEVLEDFVAIAQIQDALEESEDGETDYMEVMEYLRVAPMLLFSECAAPEAAPAKPSLH